MKKNFRKVLSVVMILTMVFAMTATAFAGTNTEGTVTVSVVQNNFNLDGSYKGSYSNPVTLGSDGTTIENYEVPISTVEEYVEMGYKYLYLPTDAEDPMNGKASVLDAIIVALDLNGITDIDAGWDSTNLPEYNMFPGGYIHNIDNNVEVGNTVSYFKGENGNKWGRSVGAGWNIAYGQTGEILAAPTGYASNIELTDGMNIIIDISAFDMTWDTHTEWAA